MIELKGFDFKFSLNYDYDTSRNCSESGCDDEGICRCGTIENARVTSVNISEMVSEIMNVYYDGSIVSNRHSKINSILGDISKEIDFYTIDRIFRINKVYEPSNWDVQITDGYYGQEIDDIVLDYTLAEKIETQIVESLNISDLPKRVEWLLNLEYGRILPELQNCQYELIKIKRDSVIFGSENQKRRVAGEKLDHYSDAKYHSIRGIVIPKNGEYRLIDGYHRCFASENKFITVISAKL